MEPWLQPTNTFSPHKLAGNHHRVSGNDVKYLTAHTTSRAIHSTYHPVRVAHSHPSDSRKAPAAKWRVTKQYRIHISGSRSPNEGCHQPEEGEPRHVPLNMPCSGQQMGQLVHWCRPYTSPTGGEGEGSDRVLLFPQTSPSPQGDYSNVDSDGRTAHRQCTQSRRNKECGVSVVRYWTFGCACCFTTRPQPEVDEWWGVKGYWYLAG